jgi:hypothetical protein
MKKILSLFFLALLVLACSKNKFKTEPQVEIKSFGPEVVTVGGTFALSAIVRDKEGDLQDTLILFEKRYDTTNVLLTTDSTKKYKLRDLGVTSKNSELEVNFRYSYGPQILTPTYYTYASEFRNTRFAVGIVIKDNAGHRSEYVESGKILLKKP